MPPELPFLTIRNRQAARLIAEGHSLSEAAKQLGMSAQRIRALLEDERFKVEVERFARSVSQTIEEQIIEDLVRVERKAVAVLEELLESKDDEVRFKAVTTALDRAGRRGKVADKVEQKIATYNANQGMEQQLQAALRDPAVRKMLEQKPEMLKMLPMPEVEDAAS
jgi:DNA-binding CsgD family transcriptional regulator